MAKSRKFQITLTGTLPKGMTLSQGRYAVWNQNLDLDIDVSQFIDGARGDKPMKMRIGKASMVKSDG